MREEIHGAENQQLSMVRSRVRLQFSLPATSPACLSESKSRIAQKQLYKLFYNLEKVPNLSLGDVIILHTWDKISNILEVWNVAILQLKSDNQNLSNQYLNTVLGADLKYHSEGSRLLGQLDSVHMKIDASQCF